MTASLIGVVSEGFFITESRLVLSSAAVSGIFISATSAAVAMMSTSEISWLDLVSGLMVPGQQAMKGTRWPPSNASAFVPRQWFWSSAPPFLSFAKSAFGEVPLSVVKMTSVSSAMPLRVRAWLIWPTHQSVSMRKSA